MADELHRWLAANLRAAMKKRGWSHRLTAELAGVSLGNLNDILSGKVSPTVKWLDRVGTALDVPIADLLKRPRR